MLSAAVLCRRRSTLLFFFPLSFLRNLVRHSPHRYANCGAPTLCKRRAWKKKMHWLGRRDAAHTNQPLELEKVVLFWSGNGWPVVAPTVTTKTRYSPHSHFFFVCLEYLLDAVKCLALHICPMRATTSYWIEVWKQGEERHLMRVQPCLLLC